MRHADAHIHATYIRGRATQTQSHEGTHNDDIAHAGAAACMSATYRLYVRVRVCVCIRVIHMRCAHLTVWKKVESMMCVCVCVTHCLTHLTV